MADKTANIDYLCVIRENNGKTTFETIDIPVSTDLVTKLEGLTKNANATVLDMQAQMNLAFNENQRRAINYVSPYSYGNSYINITYYPAILSFAGYKEKLTAHKDSLREKFSSKNQILQEKDLAKYQAELDDYLEREMSQYTDDLKCDYLQVAKRYIRAFNYSQTLCHAKERGDLRMFSTDTLGWSNFTYQVTDEIIITLGTNFGYGKASYFRLGLSYKGIDILPYSYMVKYYYANSRDLLRYTRLYDVAHDSWNLAFSFVEKAANLASESAEEFVRHWILNEVEDMVHRLHGVLENPDDYIQDILNKTGEKADCDYFTVRNMYSNEKRRYGVFPEEMTMAIRSEKLTGALDFLVNLSALSATLPEIEAYIAEIKEMAVAIIPELDEMVKKITVKVALQQEEKAHLEVKLADLKNKLEPHEIKVNELYENRKEEEKRFHRRYYEIQYGKSHKEYVEMKEEESNTSEIIAKLAEEIVLRSSFRDNLQECRTRVSDASLIVADSIEA